MTPQLYKMSKKVEAMFAEATKALHEEAKQREPGMVELILDLHAEMVPDLGASTLLACVAVVSDPKQMPPRTRVYQRRSTKSSPGRRRR